MKPVREDQIERIVFAVDTRGHIMPIFASGKGVEWHVYEDTETDWNFGVDIAGIPAEPGLYVWEGVPRPDMESEEGVGSYCIGYIYSNSWRRLDQIEWLALMEGACPWASRREEKEEPDYIDTFPVEDPCPHEQLYDKKVTVCLDCGENIK